MSNMNIDSVLAQIRSLQAQTKLGVPASAKPVDPMQGAGQAAGTAASVSRMC